MTWKQKVRTDTKANDSNGESFVIIVKMKCDNTIKIFAGSLKLIVIATLLVVMQLLLKLFSGIIYFHSTL